MKPIIDAILKIAVWVVAVPCFSFTMGYVLCNTRWKETCVEAGVAEWRVDKQGKVTFHLKGDKNAK